MLYGFLSRSRKKPSWLQLKHSILRNFGGLENVKPVDIFYDKLSHLVDKDEEVRQTIKLCYKMYINGSDLYNHNVNQI